MRYNSAAIGKLWCMLILGDHKTEQYIYSEQNSLWYDTKQRAEREGITEKLKADHPMEWVQRISSLRLTAIETANAEGIFV